MIVNCAATVVDQKLPISVAAMAGYDNDAAPLARSFSTIVAFGRVFDNASVRFIEGAKEVDAVERVRTKGARARGAARAHFSGRSREDYRRPRAACRIRSGDHVPIVRWRTTRRAATDARLIGRAEMSPLLSLQRPRRGTTPSRRDCGTAAVSGRRLEGWRNR